MIREGENIKQKTALDDDAALYAKRDDKGTLERFKELKGREKYDFFCQYMLGRILAVVCIAGLLIWIGFSVLAPKPENVCYIAVIDNPLLKESAELLEAKLNEFFVTDPKKQTVNLDRDYYMSLDDYNARMRFMTLLAAGDIDFVVIPENEIGSYSESGMYADLGAYLDADTLAALDGKLLNMVDSESGETFIGGINISESLEKINGYEFNMDYYLVMTVNTKNADNLRTVMSLFLEF